MLVLDCTTVADSGTNGNEVFKQHGVYLTNDILTLALNEDDLLFLRKAVLFIKCMQLGLRPPKLGDTDRQIATMWERLFTTSLAVFETYQEFEELNEADQEAYSNEDWEYLCKNRSKFVKPKSTK